MKRCFIALELNKETVSEIKRIQKLIKDKTLFTGKLTDPENLHLTLKFLGEINNKRLEEVRKILVDIRFNRFEAELGEVGVFSEKFIKIVWVKLNGKAFGLQKLIDDSLEGLFKPEFRFMSHITIARIKNVRDKKAFLDYIRNLKTKKVKFEVDKFYLNKSELKPEGPVYETIRKYSLGS